ncbi:hypothetical protein QJS66_18595 [Kocuria rhizophila]|nr:hypothetical protein QJS66_18595 [Kocuria rhizophila]
MTPPLRCPRVSAWRRPCRGRGSIGRSEHAAAGGAGALEHAVAGRSSVL